MLEKAERWSEIGQLSLEDLFCSLRGRRAARQEATVSVQGVRRDESKSIYVARWEAMSASRSLTSGGLFVVAAVFYRILSFQAQSVNAQMRGGRWALAAMDVPGLVIRISWNRQHHHALSLPISRGIYYENANAERWVLLRRRLVEFRSCR